MKPKATSIIPTPAAAIGSRDSMDCHDWESPETLRSPFQRYRRDIPYIPIADATDPTMKYFVPASPPSLDSLWKPTRT